MPSLKNLNAQINALPEGRHLSIPPRNGEGDRRPLRAVVEGSRPTTAPTGTEITQALIDVLAMRQQQIDMGHTPEADAQHPLFHLPRLARRFIDSAIDRLMAGGNFGGRFENQALARTDLLKATAILIAAIERLDAVQPGSGPQVMERPL